MKNKKGWWNAKPKHSKMRLAVSLGISIIGLTAIVAPIAISAKNNDNPNKGNDTLLELENPVGGDESVNTPVDNQPTTEDNSNNETPGDGAVGDSEHNEEPAGQIPDETEAVLIDAVNEIYEINNLWMQKMGDHMAVVNRDDRYFGTITIPIPSSVNIKGTTLAVTNIAENAFQNCISLESVIIPNSVETICDSAFANCRSLIEITFKGNPMNIALGVNVFNNVSENGTIYLNYYANPIEICEKFGLNNWNVVFDIEDTGSNEISLGGLTLEKNDADDFITITNVDTSISGNLMIPDVIYINGQPLEVREIESGAFKDCTNIESVVIGNNVQSIGQWAFLGCTSLESIIIGNNVETIGQAAFANCENLETIIIPASVTQIGNSAFKGCKLSNFDLDSNNLAFDIITAGENSKILVEKDVTNFTNGEIVGNLVVGEIIIPDTVTEIGANAFYGCTSIESIEIPDSVASIGTSAFAGCTIESIKIPDLVTTISSNAFGWCPNLESVIIGENVEIIESGAFANCISLESITFGDSIEVIDSNAFYGCTSLETVIIGNNTKTIGWYTFAGCTNLTSIIIPNSVKTIGDHAFVRCQSLNTIIFEGDPMDINFGNDIMNPESKTEAFANIAESGTIIINCYTIADANQICEMVGLDKDNWEVVFNVKIEPLEEGKFLLNGLTLEKNDADDFITITNADKSISGELVIPNSVYVDGQVLEVREIKNNAFRECINLESVIISDNVETIGDYAFQDCSSLEKVTINSVKTIGFGAFYGCSSLEKVTINSVKTIGSGAFRHCSSLTKIFMTNVETIGDYAFFNCSSLEEVTINNVKTIGQTAFHLCSSLKEVTINNVETIETDAFLGCSNLEKVTINNVKTIREFAFSECENLKEVTINNVKTIGQNAFYGCLNLTKITFKCKPSESLTSRANIFYNIGEAGTIILDYQNVNINDIDASICQNWGIIDYNDWIITIPSSKN